MTKLDLYTADQRGAITAGGTTVTTMTDTNPPIYCADNKPSTHCVVEGDDIFLQLNLFRAETPVQAIQL